MKDLILRVIFSLNRYNDRAMSHNQHYRDLYKLIVSASSEKEVEMLLKDLLTPQELDSVAERWQLIRMLDEGVPQRDIAKKLGLSISKITRGSRMLQYGSGGFSLFLKKFRGE